jgi:hypothetical protein
MLSLSLKSLLRNRIKEFRVCAIKVWASLTFDPATLKEASAEPRGWLLTCLALNLDCPPGKGDSS